MKVFNIFFCLVFIFFAALQYNDRDPYVWMPIYLYAAALCWLAFRNKFYPGVYLIGVAVYALYALYKMFDTNGLIDWITKHKCREYCRNNAGRKTRVEESREFFGLVI